MIFDRFTNDETITVAINMSDIEVGVEVVIGGTVLLSSDQRRAFHSFDHRLAPYEAVVISAR